MKLRLAWLGWLLITGFVLGLTFTSPAQAEASGYLLKAAKAWENAELKKAADLYQKALDEGGLYPPDVLVAYARIGTVRAAMRQKTAALSAFRIAAVLDPSFELPSEAGRIAQRLYKKARKEAVQGGKLTVTAEVPSSANAGKPFVVVAHMDEAYVPLVVNIGITVQDPSISGGSVRPWTAKKPADTTVKFKVPGKVVVSGANLLVRVDALDGNDNRWASSQARVVVRGGKAELHFSPQEDPFWDEKKKKGKKKKGGSFWTSPWPWVIGGVVVAGGAAAYFMTRPSTDYVQVQAPTW